MQITVRTHVGISTNGPCVTRFFERFLTAAWLLTVMLTGTCVNAQVNVLTQHNDNARTGQNVKETILTPANVNSTTFGKLFSQKIVGVMQAQPLYVSQVAIPNKGTHNVVYAVTEGDYVYAFDADTNGGINANSLWQLYLPSTSTTALSVQYGVLGTPVIDLPSKTMYLASSEISGSTSIVRLHALDITTGAEKFGAPFVIQGSVAGTGVGSSGGTLTFNATYQYQRPGLLLLNGVLYVGFSSYGDNGPWHGWIFSYSLNATTQALQLLNIFCTSPNGTGAGIWMAGAGLAAEVNNPAKPYGRMFISTGNGSFNVTAPTKAGPYTNASNAYSMSVVDLDLTGGQMTVEDYFSPFNEAALNAQDGDLGSGGPVLLPTQTLASGKTLNPLVEVGKSGMIYVLDRDNNNDGSNNAATEYSPSGLGGHSATYDPVEQEVQTPIIGYGWGSGVWGTGAYWNGNLYYGGTNVTAGTYTGGGNSMAAYSFANGVLSGALTSQTSEVFAFPGPTPSVSANGTTNGIVWALKNDFLDSLGYAALLAYDANNLGNTLYSSNDNVARDNPGLPASFNVPTIANGKVYTGANGELSVFGLFGTTPTAPTPAITPSSGKFATPPTVTITDTLGGATIYYTTNGTTPTSASAIYQGPFTATSNETVTAIASVTGYLLSAPATATYLSTTTPANPVLSLAAGSYVGTQTVTITDPTPGAIVYYTMDGSTPTTTSAIYTQPISVTYSQTVSAVAMAAGPITSSVVSANYTIQPANTIDFSQGFSLAQESMQFNGSTDLDDFRLQLTDGGPSEAGSAFYVAPVNIQSFTTNFTFQLSNSTNASSIADGITFTIQNTGSAALGGEGAALGYAGIPHSLAIKFDLFSNSGEGINSTGLYINGAAPTMPAIDLTASGVNLHDGDFFNATLTYDGTTLTMVVSDAITLATFTHSWAVNIPSLVGGNTAYVGFTGATGGLTSSQKINAWTFLSGAPLPNYTAGFVSGSLTLNGGATLSGTALRMTDGGQAEAHSAFFNTPVNIQQFSTSFDFQLQFPAADGLTFTIQGVGPTALGGPSGGLGYSGILKSVAVKFDLYSNAGEGPDSTGMYINGASPEAPAIDLSSTGIDLHNGDTFNALLTYQGTTLTVTITDTVTNASATQTYTVNIPATVGGNTAYVGFTAGTGGLTSVQQVLNWNFTPYLLRDLPLSMVLLHPRPS